MEGVRRHVKLFAECVQKLIGSPSPHMAAIAFWDQYGTVRGMDKNRTVPDQQTTLHPYTSRDETVAVIVKP